MFFGEDVVCETIMLPETTAYFGDVADAGISSALGATVAVAALVILLMLVGVAIYIIPTIIALARRHSQKVPIILVNILLGWTLVGWIVALVWSLVNDQPRNNFNNGMYNNMYDNYGGGSNNNFNNMNM